MPRSIGQTPTNRKRRIRETCPHALPVLERTSGKTLIAFYPQTGRTHQLRVHAAHPQGLHCPILGDELYGRKAERLYLHAEYLAFTHPITSERIEIRAKIPFSQHLKLSIISNN